MVYNEVMPGLASPPSGFTSPLSSPETYPLECCQEVPSPSQYSDPSCSPPSMHSPPPRCPPDTTDHQLEQLLKEEPLSPYNNGGGFVTAIMMTPPHPGQQQQQLFVNCNNNVAEQQQQQQQQQLHQYQMQQNQYHQQQQQQQPYLLPHKMDFSCPSFQMSATESTVSDFDLQQILNHPEMAKTVDCLMTQEDHLLFQEEPTNFHHPQQQNNFPQQVVAPSNGGHFVTTQQQQQQQQLYNKNNTQQQQLLANPEVFTSLPSELLSTTTNQQLMTTVVGPAAAVPEVAPITADTTFSRLLETPDIKTEQATSVDCCPNVDAFYIMDTIMSNIMNEAGVSHSPCDWTSADVRKWLKKSAETWNIPIGEMGANVNIDGASLLLMSPAQFASVMGSNESDTLREFLCQWMSLRNEADSKIALNSFSVDGVMQVKLETGEQQELKQEVGAPHPMLPASVVNHNLQSQGAPAIALLPPYKLTTQMQQQPAENKVPQETQFRNYQQQQHTHNQQQQQNVKELMIQPTESCNSLSRFALNQSGQSFNQQSSFPVNNQPNALTDALSIQQGNHSVRHSLNKPTSPMESQISSQQHAMASPKSSPVPLREGANGYLDDSGTDLSALLQHPTTLDQDDHMETDEEEETPATTPTPPTTTGSGSSGRTHIQLWQFLKELLANNKRYGSCIRWLDRQEAIFKIEDSVKVATLWGERKNRPQMNYDKLSRSIRQYYNKNIMKKTERSQRLVYQFCDPYGQ